MKRIENIHIEKLSLVLLINSRFYSWIGAQGIMISETIEIA